MTKVELTVAALIRLQINGKGLSQLDHLMAAGSDTEE